MNREIKFRVIVKYKNGLIDIFDQTCGDWRLEFNEGHEAGLLLWDYENCRWKKCDEDIEILEWTGLKDRNGKEIYEGDIVETSHRVFDEDKTHLNEVVFSDFCWRVHSIGDDKAADIPLGLYAREPESIVIVGNIYEGEKTE